MKWISFLHANVFQASEKKMKANFAVLQHLKMQLVEWAFEG